MKNFLNVKNIIAILLLTILAACGNKNTTKEIITFRDIPLGMPGVKDSLVKICFESSHNFSKDFLNELCSFNDQRTLIQASYGNLRDKWTFITLGGGNKTLENVEITGPKQELLELAKLLETKYGQPAKEKNQIENRLGTKFDQEILTWIDANGSRITVESIYSKIDEGRVIIESASSVAAQDAEKQKDMERNKKNL